MCNLLITSFIWTYAMVHKAMQNIVFSSTHGGDNLYHFYNLARSTCVILTFLKSPIKCHNNCPLSDTLSRWIYDRFLIWNTIICDASHRKLWSSRKEIYRKFTCLTYLKEDKWSGTWLTFQKCQNDTTSCFPMCLFRIILRFHTYIL